MQVCNPQEIRQAHSQFPPNSRVSLEKPLSLTWLHTLMPNSHMKNLERYLMKRPTCTRCQPSWWSFCLSSTASSVLQPLLEIHSSFTLWLCPGKIAKVYTKPHVQILKIWHSIFCQLDSNHRQPIRALELWESGIKWSAIYRKVASFNTSCLKAHAGNFRLLMTGIFDILDMMFNIYFRVLWTCFSTSYVMWASLFTNSQFYAHRN